MKELLIFPLSIITLTILLALSIGSFMNVIIYRLPLWLKTNWQYECEKFLKPFTFNDNTQPNLLKAFWSRSYCPHCRITLLWQHNIPLLSYLILRGRCYYCQKNISLSYPLIELLSVVLALFLIWNFHLSLKCLAAMFLTSILIILSVIDLRHQLLPDIITLPTLWVGLILSLNGMFSSPQNAITGALLGYGLPWLIARLFKWVRHKEGMGHGDFKMFAMLGAWFGPQILLSIIFLSSCLGLLVGIILFLKNKTQQETLLSFGPFIAIAGWVGMISNFPWFNWMT